MFRSAAPPTSPSQALTRLGPSLSPLKGGEGLCPRPTAGPWWVGSLSLPTFLFCAFAWAAGAADLDGLVRAYPQQLAGYDAIDLIWRDGMRMPLSDGQPHKSLAELLRHGSILDQISLPYPAGLRPAAFG